MSSARTEYYGLLRHDSDSRTDRLGPRRRHINPINQDASGLGIIKPHQELKRCAFACARRADKCNSFSGFYIQ